MLSVGSFAPEVMVSIVGLVQGTLALVVLVALESWLQTISLRNEVQSSSTYESEYEYHDQPASMDVSHVYCEDFWSTSPKLLNLLSSIPGTETWPLFWFVKRPCFGELTFNKQTSWLGITPLQLVLSTHLLGHVLWLSIRLSTHPSYWNISQKCDGRSYKDLQITKWHELFL